MNIKNQTNHKLTTEAGRVNVRKICKTILSKTHGYKSSDYQSNRKAKRTLDVLMSIFRNTSRNGRVGRAHGFKTGHGMLILEKFINEIA